MAYPGLAYLLLLLGTGAGYGAGARAGVGLGARAGAGGGGEKAEDDCKKRLNSDILEILEIRLRVQICVQIDTISLKLSFLLFK